MRWGQRGGNLKEQISGWAFLHKANLQIIAFSIHHIKRAMIKYNRILQRPDGSMAEEIVANNWVHTIASLSVATVCSQLLELHLSFQQTRLNGMNFLLPSLPLGLDSQGALDEGDTWLTADATIRPIAIGILAENLHNKSNVSK